MNIEKISVSLINLPLKTPFTISYASYDVMPSIIVEIHCDNGIVGYGEGVADEHVTGETIESTYQVLTKTLAPNLIGENPKDMEHIHEIMDKLILGSTTAKAAIDIACYDATGKYLNVPVYDLLGGKYHEKYALTHVLSIESPENMAREAYEKVEKGYNQLKLKVGDNVDEDIERILAVRNRVGRKVKMRVDVNQGWKSPTNSVKALRQLEDANLDWIEQPTLAGDIDGLRDVKNKSTVTIMADEALLGKKELRELIAKNACDKINIKLMKCGGIYPAKKLATMAELANLDCQIGSMVESSIGSAAGFHVGFSQKNITSVELTGPLKFSKDIGDLYYDIPYIFLNGKPGLGVKVDKEMLSSLTVEQTEIAI